jgi:uncharacterized protein (DUF1501 family)
MRDRRSFLQQIGLFSVGAIASSSYHHWIARAVTPSKNNSRLIVIFLRGAVDGLSVVAPYGEAAYYEARPKISIPKPSKSGEKASLIDLDGDFGLHPALKDLMPLWQGQDLAFVHACGCTDNTRSHFEAQDYMESGTPGIKTTPDGWMNRLMAVLSGRNPIQAVNVGQITPRILKGRIPVATIASGRKAIAPMPLDRPQIRSTFDRLYDGNDTLSQNYREGQLARQELLDDLKDLDMEQKMANNGAPSPYGFAKDAQRIARLMAQDDRVQLAFMDLGGWDTHINQGNGTGQLARNLHQLGQGIVALKNGLGKVYGNTTILVISEFGRTVRENGNGGTDHGHGNVMWVLGGSIKGGKVHGKWPGLVTSALYQERDLAITTDFRDVVGTVLSDRFELDRSQIAKVFPNFQPIRSLSLV